jgi:hypothetical protein
LAASEHGKHINANASSTFAAYEDWTVEIKAVFHRICDVVNEALGYETAGRAFDIPKEAALRALPNERSATTAERSREVVSAIDFREASLAKGCWAGCELQLGETGLKISPQGSRHAHFLIGGGRWQKLAGPDGWSADLYSYYRGVLNAEVQDKGSAKVLCLMYDENGTLIGKRPVAQVRSGSRPVPFSFKLRGRSSRFNLALYMSATGLPQSVMLKSFMLERIPLA